MNLERIACKMPSNSKEWCIYNYGQFVEEGLYVVLKSLDDKEYSVALDEFKNGQWAYGPTTKYFISLPNLGISTTAKKVNLADVFIEMAKREIRKKRKIRKVGQTNVFKK